MKKKFFYFSKLRNRIIAFFLAASFVPFMLLAGASWYNYQKTINNNALSYTQQIMSLTSNKLEDFFNKLDQFYYSVYAQNFPEHLSNMEHSNKKGILSRITLSRTISQLQNFYGLYRTVPYFTIVDSTGKIFYQTDTCLTSSYTFAKEDWFTEFISSNSRTSISRARFLPYHNTDFGHSNISYAKKIITNGSTGNSYTFIMDFSADIISDLLAPLMICQTSNFYILSGNDIVYAQNPNDLTPDEVMTLNADCFSNNNYCHTRIRKVPQLVTAYPIKNTPLSILCTNPIHEITANVPDLKSFTLLLLTVNIFLTVVLAFLFSKKIVKPIQELKKVTYEVMDGNLDVHIQPLTHDEIGDLGKCLEKMVANINQLIREKYEYTLREKELQLQTLQFQINPHFLYNTLETISSIAEDSGLDEVSHIALSMADLYRYSISSSDRLVPIRNEVTYIRNYLDIIKVRHGDRILIHFDLDEEALNYPIMKLTLQPLIENAIHHGLENKCDTGNLTISIKKEEKLILIKIMDDGAGIELNRLKKLQVELSECNQSSMKKTNNHIGILNVYQRLMLRFENSCDMQIESKLSEGTCVSIRLPIQPELPV